MTCPQHLLAATLLASLALSSTAARADQTDALRAECAARHGVTLKAGAADEHVFVYHRGELRGELQPGESLPCSASQYKAYVASLDPARLLALQPSAAGKPAIEEHVFTYKKGVLQSAQ